MDSIDFVAGAGARREKQLHVLSKYADHHAPTGLKFVDETLSCAFSIHSILRRHRSPTHVVHIVVDVVNQTLRLNAGGE
ncbi:MAG: hypothetical protein AAF633_22020 [Chloroflexota bacterium]